MQVSNIQSTNNSTNFNGRLRLNTNKSIPQIKTSYPTDSYKLIDKSEHSPIYRFFAKLYRDLIDKIDYIRE